MNAKFAIMAFRTLVGILFAIVAFFSKETYESIQTLNSNMINLQIKIATLETSMMTEDRVRDIARMEILDYCERRNSHGRD